MEGKNAGRKIQRKLMKEGRKKKIKESGEGRKGGRNIPPPALPPVPALPPGAVP
jgi:hypothetical protein